MNGLGWLLRTFTGLRVPFSARCPMCGKASVRSRIARPLGSVVKDAPIVAQMSCAKCGYRWSVPLRVGP